jgi:hypothetical protein
MDRIRSIHFVEQGRHFVFEPNHDAGCGKQQQRQEGENAERVVLVGPE